VRNCKFDQILSFWSFHTHRLSRSVWKLECDID